MSIYLNKTVNFWIENGDSRSSKWILTSSPLPVVIIIVVYVVLVGVSKEKY